MLFCLAPIFLKYTILLINVYLLLIKSPRDVAQGTSRVGSYRCIIVNNSWHFSMFYYIYIYIHERAYLKYNKMHNASAYH